MEEWKPIPRYDGFYEASSSGRIRSLPRSVHQSGNCRGLVLRRVGGKVISDAGLASGHRKVVLCVLGDRKNELVHRLVLEAFVGPCPNGMECCHNNGNPEDNRIENLRWDTRKANHEDSIRHGTDCRMERSGMAKLSEMKVRIIRTILRDSGGIRGCQRMLARLFDVSDTTIYDIKIGKIWKEVHA